LNQNKVSKTLLLCCIAIYFYAALLISFQTVHVVMAVLKLKIAHFNSHLNFNIPQTGRSLWWLVSKI